MVPATNQFLAPRPIPNYPVSMRDSFLPTLRKRKLRNVVVRQICDRDCHSFDYLTHPHNGSQHNIIAAARAV